MSSPDAKSTERFSDRVEHYVRYRPAYPDAVVAILRDGIGLTPAWTLADIGSGTGISAQLFLASGNTVYGVEPNPPMREAAERLLATYPNFRSMAGTAESTTLPDSAVDAVVAAQAFHWFDVSQARAEFLRILRPGGWVVLMWNARRLASTPFLRDYEALLLEFGTDYQSIRHERVDKTALADFFGNAAYHNWSVENQQRLDYEGLEGRLLSSSYIPTAGAPRHTEMLTALRQLFDHRQHGGYVTIEYDTQLHAGQLAM